MAGGSHGRVAPIAAAAGGTSRGLLGEAGLVCPFLYGGLLRFNIFSQIGSASVSVAGGRK